MLGLGKSVIYLIKALMFGIASVVAIPREEYKKYLLYGMFFGGFLDIVLLVVLHLGFHTVSYYHQGPFSIFGIFPFWTPVSWMFTFMIFFYYLPARKLFMYFYIVFFAIYGVFVGLVLEGFGIYSFNKLVAFGIFLAWFTLAAFGYNYLERRNLTSEIRKR